MTVFARVRRARVLLAGIITVRAALWASVVGFGSYSALAYAVGRGTVPLAVAGVLAFPVLVANLWRGRRAWSVQRTALWIEAKAPQLEYALVTAIDPAAGHVLQELERVSNAVDVERLVWRAGMLGVGRAAAAAVMAAAFLVLVPPRRGGTSTDVAPQTVHATQNHLVPLVVRVTPPAYVHRSGQTIREPASVAGFVGSVVEVSGQGDGTGIRAAMGRDTAPVSRLATGWTARFTMPRKPTVLRLTDGGFTRLLGLDPVEDNPPTVTLGLPIRDSTLGVARGELRLEARATDDIGLHDGYFELIVSSGDQEGSFRSAVRRAGYAALDAADVAPREGVIRASVDLGSLGLTSGGLLSIRAVVRDGNTVSGPGIGTSETRTYRVARFDEADSVAIEGVLPPGLDSSYLSQRMVVIRTRALVRTANRLAADIILQQSRGLADKEELLRDRLRQLLGIAADEEADSAPGAAGVGINRRAWFDTAYQFLGDASRELTTGHPAAALGPELVALRVLDAARVARRLYMRGAPPTVVVNTARVRLSGTERAAAGARTPTPPRDTLQRVEMQRIDRALELVRGSVSAEAADSLALWRADMLAEWPEAAAALGDASRALREGRAADLRTALARARRALIGGSTIGPGLSAWDGGSE